MIRVKEKHEHNYRLVRAKGHPRVNTEGRVYEHVLVVEKALGHFLRKSADVHHVNHDGSDNANTNLVACQDRTYHKLIETRTRAYDATGNPDLKQCWACRGWFPPEEFGKHVGHERAGQCKKCAASLAKEWGLKNPERLKEQGRKRYHKKLGHPEGYDGRRKEWRTEWRKST
jgi:hypothetical protein